MAGKEGDCVPNGHGGKRPGAGRPRKSLADKQLEGMYGKRRPKVLNFPETEEEYNWDFPPRLEYYASRVSGLPNIRNIWEETVDFLRKTDCLHLIKPSYVEQYTIAMNRFYEMERVLTNTHPIYQPKTDSNGKGMDKLELNPAVEASIKYQKQAEVLWDRIWAIVAQNCETYFGDDPNQDIMARLLSNKPR